MIRRRLAPLCRVAVLCLVTVPAQAQTRIDTWTTDNGLPQNSVTALTQTPDGYIWLTTQEGLVRFDGVRFTVFNRSNTPAITNNRMSGAFADRRGRIWMNTEEGQILSYEKGVFTVAMKTGEVPADLRSRFFADPDGDVIFSVNHRNHRDGTASYKHYRHKDGRFVPMAIDGVTEQDYLVLSDKEGGLWFAGGQRLRRFKDGVTRTYDFSGFGAGNINALAYEDRHGSLWLSYSGVRRQLLVRIRNGKIQSFPTPLAPLADITEDPQGRLWVSLFNRGVYRIRGAESDEPGTDLLEPVLLTDRIANIGYGFLSPDREGGMWVGTNGGLVRLSPETFRTFSRHDGLPEENVYPILEDRAGRIWAGIWENSLVRYENGRFTTVLRTEETNYPTSLFEDRSGRLWVGTIADVFYLVEGTLVKFTSQAGFTAKAEFSVISQDTDGNLWFGTNLGLSRYAAGRASVFTKADGLPDDYVVALLQARDGTIWIGTRGGLASIAGGKINSFTTADGLASNSIRSLYEDGDRVLWIGTYDGGLTRLKGGKFTRVSKNEGLSSNGVFCILEDDAGWLWMNSNQGIYRARKQDVHDVADGKIGSLTAIAYNRQDGLLNVEGNGGRQPAGIRARDGTLWFPTAEGIATVNPATININRLAPRTLIEAVLIDRVGVPPERLHSAVQGGSGIVLQPNQNNLEIAYTGISFVNSEQVKFKYKLESLEPDWNEVGTRRTAYYSYLRPGTYTFHVMAANRDGLWSAGTAAVTITVLPPFYMTGWFLATCAVTMLALLWSVHRYRVLQVRHAFEMTLEARVGERTRIARELHDTLLQGFHGLLLRFQTVSHLLPGRASEAKDLLDSAIVQAAASITEGRDAVQGLRASALETNDLAQGIRNLGDELAGITLRPARFSVTVEGAPRQLQPILRDEIYKIAAEAIRNAYRHAEARHIEVELHYGRDELRMRVRDDGKGIDPAVLASHGTQGHFGLRGLNERATLIGGKLAIWSDAGAGTEVELRVPASVVYLAAPRRPGFFGRSAARGEP
jgi:signal transduction histidine kinase/ligand-binding sensor domain-containing protein